MAGQLDHTGHQSRPSVLAATERHRRALELRLSGMNLAEIARRLGYASEGGALKAIKLALKKSLREPAEAYRKLELERIDRMFQVCWEKTLDDSLHIESRLNAMDRALKWHVRRCELLGLNAPKRHLHGQDPNADPIQLDARHAVISIDALGLPLHVRQALLEALDRQKQLSNPATTPTTIPTSSPVGLLQELPADAVRSGAVGEGAARPTDSTVRRGTEGVGDGVGPSGTVRSGAEGPGREGDDPGPVRYGTVPEESGVVPPPSDGPCPTPVPPGPRESALVSPESAPDAVVSREVWQGIPVEVLGEVITRSTEDDDSPDPT